MDQHIVSLFVMQINSNVFSEHKLTPMTNLITLYGAMKLQFSLRITDVFATGKMERSLDQNLARSIPLKFMSGLESARKVLLLCAFLRELWRLLCIVRSWNVHFSHSYDRNFHLHAHTGQRSKTYISSSSKLLFPVRHQLVVHSSRITSFKSY